MELYVKMLPLLIFFVRLQVTHAHAKAHSPRIMHSQESQALDTEIWKIHNSDFFENFCMPLITDIGKMPPSDVDKAKIAIVSR